MKKIVYIVKLDLVMRIAPGKNLRQQRRFFSAAKRKRKHNVKAWFMSQNMFAQERVVKDEPIRDTKEGAIKLTKGMTKMCLK